MKSKNKKIKVSASAKARKRSFGISKSFLRSLLKFAENFSGGK